MMRSMSSVLRTPAITLSEHIARGGVPTFGQKWTRGRNQVLFSCAGVKSAALVERYIDLELCSE